MAELDLPGMGVRRCLEYGYSNTRVKAMKTKLLDRATMNGMISAGGLEDIIAILERTEYREDLVEYSIKYGGAMLVEFALGRNLAKTYRKLMYVSPDDARETLSVLAGKWDISNLKMIFLSKRFGRGMEEIRPYLVPAGVLKEKELGDLMEQETVGEIVGMLGRLEYGTVLEREFGIYEGTGDLLPILSALDRWRYGKLAGAVKIRYREDRIVDSLIRMEIDVKNISTVLRMKGERAAAEEIRRYIIEGGNVGEKAMDDMIRAKGIEESLSGVERYYDLKPALEPYKRDGSLVHFENLLEEQMIRRGVHALRFSILSTGSILGYLYLKEAEISNIRKIVRAKEFGLPDEKTGGMIFSMGS